jgi:hypothetical protein
MDKLTCTQCGHGIRGTFTYCHGVPLHESCILAWGNRQSYLEAEKERQYAAKRERAERACDEAWERNY